MKLAVGAALATLTACQSDRIEVAPTVNADNNRGALLAAVAELRGAGHTPAAFRGYSDKVLALRSGMDATVAEEAELLSVIEAGVVLKRARDTGVPAELLALTVWPLGLAPPVTADVPGQPSLAERGAWIPVDGESPGQYLQRLCGGVLALACKHIVPEGHTAVVNGLVVDRFAERARRAVATCLTCSEPSWGEAVAAWEALDREVVASTSAARSHYDATRFPVAGDGAVVLPPLDPKLLEVELPAAERSERVRYALDDAGEAGATRIALIAREPAYPYLRRAYLLPTTAKLPVRDGESVQVLARALDGQARQASRQASDRK